MKFAKELEQDLVPEWKAKYLNYKDAKKKLKAVGKAYRKLNSTPKSGFQRIAPSGRSPAETLQQFTFGGAQSKSQEQRGKDGDLGRKGVRFFSEQTQNGHGASAESETAPINIAKTRTNDSGGSRLTRYGSIIGTPPNDSVAPVPSEEGGAPPSLLLPGPALQPVETNKSSGRAAQGLTAARSTDGSDAHSISGSLAHRSHPSQSQPSPIPGTRHMSLFRPKGRRISSTPGPLQRTLSRRIMSLGGSMTPPASARSPDVELASYRDFDFRQAEFFDYLDRELDKIDGFYKDKEEEAIGRMKVLREQLHILRDRRLEDLVKARKSSAMRHSTAYGAVDVHTDDETHSNPTLIQKPWQRLFGEAKTIAHGGRVGKGSKAMEGLATPSQANLGIDASRDYTRRRSKHDIPYRTAKRKLKIAMQEFYRGLELLKSFALLNRTGFRKINKKYDKTVNAKPSYKYMNDKVNRAWFVQSDVVDDLIRTVEDLYARYFERGNHKIAAGKLRAKAANAGDYTGSVFRTGAFLATGLVFGIQGLVYGAERLYDPDPSIVAQTSYLLQIYAGYFLMLLLVQLFCLACRFWTYSKINYVFVFEFDARHHLNWRQISELPCFCWLLLGLFMWLNFTDYGAQAMYLYYPVLLIGITLGLLFFPLTYIYPRTRSWFLYSNWRLLLAGLYPVEFRDFFLGDMYCSQTYAMGNIELFFCLYARDWKDPPSCNSSHSRLLGFFSTLPGIWRALQCIRRYADTRNAFPHLANCGKYFCTILYYMTLSLWRVNKTSELKAVFITFATINAVYCSFWDLVMDWSLLDPYAKHRFLRERLGYRQIWLYYLAMVIDPILRFNWIFYAIFADDVQHSAVLSFFVSLSEVGRRGLWMLFRVENEHCTNVGRFRASRDVPLPYVDEGPEPAIGTENEGATTDSTEEGGRDSLTPMVSKATGADVEAGTPKTPGTQGQPSPGSLRRRNTPRTPMLTPTLRNVGTILRTAHAQDYAKKKLPENAGDAEDEGSSDDEDQDDDADAEEVAGLKQSADLQAFKDMRESDELLRRTADRGDPGDSSGGS